MFDQSGASAMGKQCEVSGKKTTYGNQITTRGKAKYLGGVGTKITGISRRTFQPNLQRVHVWLPNGTTRYVRIATSVIRNGMLTLEVDGKVQTFPLIKASKGSAKARAELKNLFPI
jgi:large subunit ribosomal protein L28